MVSENFAIVAGQVGTLFLIMGVGFLITKLGMLPHDALKSVSFILLNVIAPCLIVDAFQMERDAGALRNMGVVAVASAAYFAFAILAAMLFFRKRHPDSRVVLRAASSYPNMGYLGFPLVGAVLGAPGLMLAAVYLVVFILFQWTHLVAMFGGREHMSVRKMLLNPGMVASFVGIALFLFGLGLPAPLQRAVSSIGSMNTPLAMMLIGAQMANSHLLDLFRNRQVYLVCALKLVALPAAFALLLLPFRLPGIVFASVVILSATPSATTTGIFAQQFGRDTSLAAQAIALSTLLSIITLPIFAGLTGG